MNALTRTIGPLPLWAWVVIAGAILLLLARRGGGGGGPIGVGPPGVIPGTGGGFGGGVTGFTAGGPTFPDRGGRGPLGQIRI